MDPLGLEKVWCVAKPLWPMPIYGECIYGGFCIGTISKQIYPTLGGVEPLPLPSGKLCKKCSGICTWTMEGNQLTQDLHGWKCFPPMPIKQKPMNPDPTMPPGEF